MIQFARLGRASAAVATALATLCTARGATIPSTVQPGAIERNLPPAPSAAPARPEIAIPPPPPIAAPSGAESISFQLDAVVIDGATALSAGELADTYGGSIGHKVTLAQLYRIANAITQKYAQAGYALSFAIVPAQQIDRGVAHIRVVEGFVERITYENKDVEIPPVLGEGFADKILHSRPLRTSDLERYLLLANDIPGYAVRAVFTKSADPNAPIGATDLVLKVEHRPFDTAIAVDNGAASAFGSWRGDVAASLHSPFGLGEDLQLRAVHSLADTSLGYYSAALSAPVDSEGTRARLAASYSRTKPDVLGLGSGIFSGTTWIGTLGLDQTIVRSRSQNLWLSSGVTAKILDGNILSFANSRDRLFLATIGASYEASDSGGLTAVTAAIDQGLPIFAATSADSPLRSRRSGSGAFTAALLDASRRQELFDLVLATFSIHGQAASRPLLSSEECGFGGRQYGRAFDDSRLVGDTCVMGSAELGVPVQAISPIDVPYLAASELYGFCDAGFLWTMGPLLPSEQRTTNAQSCGAGFRWAPLSGLSLSVEYAQSVFKTSAGNSDKIVSALQFGF